MVLRGRVIRRSATYVYVNAMVYVYVSYAYEYRQARRGEGKGEGIKTKTHTHRCRHYVSNAYVYEHITRTHAPVQVAHDDELVEAHARRGLVHRLRGRRRALIILFC